MATRVVAVAHFRSPLRRRSTSPVLAAPLPPVPVGRMVTSSEATGTHLVEILAPQPTMTRAGLAVPFDMIFPPRP
jgi:hypothetical protein